MSYLEPASLKALGEAYPDSSALLRHNLSGNRLLQLDALAEAAQRMKPEKVDLRLANTGNREEADFSRVFQEDKRADDVIRGIAGGGNWVGLCNIEQLPEYRDLLEEIMTEIAPVTEPLTGTNLNMVGFIFISPPHAFTPYHFDAEYNILFHISGSKQFATFPASPPYIRPEIQEAYHLTGENLLSWHDEFAEGGRVYDLGPGDALHVPYGAPHWVKAGSEPCFSLSLTWHSKWSHRNCNALKLNHALRKKGLATFSPPAWPRSAPVRSTFYRAAHKAGLL